jgi:mevalonate kinase
VILFLLYINKRIQKTNVSWKEDPYFSIEHTRTDVQEKKEMDTVQEKKQARSKLVADFVAKLFQVEKKEEDEDEGGKANDEIEMSLVAMASSDTDNKHTWLY